MSIVRWDPFGTMDNIARRMAHLAGEYERVPQINFEGFIPKIDILEDDTKVYLSAEIPGIAKEDIKLSVNDQGVLVIKGEKKKEFKGNDKEGEISLIRAERIYGEFTRSFSLPDNVNTESIKANFNNGVLCISIDKKEPEKPKEIQVTIE